VAKRAVIKGFGIICLCLSPSIPRQPESSRYGDSGITR
jgi:hypothetical protein